MSAERPYRTPEQSFDGVDTSFHRRGEGRADLPIRHRLIDGAVEAVRYAPSRVQRLLEDALRALGSNEKGKPVALAAIQDEEIRRYVPVVLAETVVDPSDPSGVRQINRFKQEDVAFTEEGLQWLERVWRGNTEVDVEQNIRRVDAMKGNLRLTTFEARVYQRIAYDRMKVQIFNDLTRMFKSDTVSPEQLHAQYEHYKSQFGDAFTGDALARDFDMLYALKAQDKLWDIDKNSLSADRAALPFLASDADRRVAVLAQFLKWRDPYTGETVRDILRELGDGKRVFDKFDFYDRETGVKISEFDHPQLRDSTSGLPVKVQPGVKVYYDDAREVFVDPDNGMEFTVPFGVRFVNTGHALADLVLKGQDRNEASLVRVATFLFLESMFVMPPTTPERIRHDIREREVHEEQGNILVNQILAAKLASYAPAPVAAMYPILSRYKNSSIAQDVPYDLQIGTVPKPRQHRFTSTGKVIHGQQSEIGDFFMKIGMTPEDVGNLTDEEIDEKYGVFLPYPAVAAKLAGAFKFVEKLTDAIRERGQSRLRSVDIARLIQGGALNAISDNRDRARAQARFMELAVAREVPEYFKPGVSEEMVVVDLNALKRRGQWDLASDMGLIYGPARIPINRAGDKLLAPEVLRLYVMHFFDADKTMQEKLVDDAPVTAAERRAGVVSYTAGEKWEMVLEEDPERGTGSPSEGILLPLKAKLFSDFAMFREGRVTVSDLLTFIGAHVVVDRLPNGTERKRVELLPEGPQWNAYVDEIVNPSMGRNVDLRGRYAGLGPEKYQLLRRFANAGREAVAARDGVDALNPVRDLPDIDTEVRNVVLAYLLRMHPDYRMMDGFLDEAANLQLQRGWIDVSGKESYAGLNNMGGRRKATEYDNFWGPIINIPAMMQHYYDLVGGLPYGLVADVATAKQYLDYREEMLPDGTTLKTIRAAHPDHIDPSLPPGLKGRISWDAYQRREVERQYLDRYTHIAQGSRDVWSTMQRPPVDPTLVKRHYMFPMALVQHTPQWWFEVARREASVAFKQMYGRDVDEQSKRDVRVLLEMIDSYGHDRNLSKAVATPLDFGKAYYYLRNKPGSPWVSEAEYQALLKAFGAQGTFRDEHGKLIPESGTVLVYARTLEAHHIDDKELTEVTKQTDKEVVKGIGKLSQLLNRNLVSGLPILGDALNEAFDNLDTANAARLYVGIAGRNLMWVAGAAAADFGLYLLGAPIGGGWAWIAGLGIPAALGEAVFEARDPGPNRGGLSALRGYDIRLPVVGWRVLHREGALHYRSRLSVIAAGRGVWDNPLAIKDFTASNSPNDNVILAARKLHIRPGYSLNDISVLS